MAGDAVLVNEKDSSDTLGKDFEVVVGDLNRTAARYATMRAHFDKLALSTLDLDPAAVAKFVADEYAFWAPLAKEVGLTVQ